MRSSARTLRIAYRSSEIRILRRRHVRQHACLDAFIELNDICTPSMHAVVMKDQSLAVRFITNHHWLKTVVQPSYSKMRTPQRCLPGDASHRGVTAQLKHPCVRPLSLHHMSREKRHRFHFCDCTPSSKAWRLRSTA